MHSQVARETMVQRQVREDIVANKERKRREEDILAGKENAGMTPRTMGRAIAEAMENTEEILKYSKHKPLDAHDMEKILSVTKRESEVSYFNKNIATFRLVKLHKVDYAAWNTDTIRWLYEYLDLSEQIKTKKS